MVHRFLDVSDLPNGVETFDIPRIYSNLVGLFVRTGSAWRWGETEGWVLSWRLDLEVVMMSNMLMMMISTHCFGLGALLMLVHRVAAHASLVRR